MMKHTALANFSLMITVGSFLLLAPYQALATRGEVKNREIYRYPHSLFSSGSVPIALLTEKTSMVLSENWVHVARTQAPKSPLGWVHVNQLLSELDLATVVRTTRETAFRLNKVLSENPQGSFVRGLELKVLEFDEGWAHVQKNNSLSSESYWVESKSLEPIERDWGVIYVPQAAALYAEAKTTAPRRALVPSGQTLKILKVVGSFFEVDLQKANRKNIHGFLHFKNVISRLQFASAIQVGGHWLDLLPETPWKIKVKGGRRIQLDEIQAFKSGQTTYFTKSPETLALNSPAEKNSATRAVPFLLRLTGLSNFTLKWAQSNIDGHGVVWWIANSESALGDDGSQNKFRLSDLKKRGLFQIVKHPLKPQIQFASAGGLFRTVDGLNWEKLSQFEGENQPLAITRSGILFAGNFRSHDLGDNFEPYFRMERLLMAVTQAQGRAPKKLSITELKLPRHDDQWIRMKVNMGGHRPVWVETDDAGMKWKAL